MGLASTGVPGQAPAPQREARGWLELDRSQKAYRERVEPMTPAEESTLEQIERGQELDLRRLDQHQQRREQEFERRERFTMPDQPPPLPRPGVTLRESNRQRLDLRIEQETLRGGEF